MFGLIAKFKLYLIIGGILLAIVAAATFYYKDSQNQIRILTQNNSKLEIAVDTQKETITTIQDSFKLQTTELLAIGLLNQELQADKNALTSIINGHDWEALSRAKPGLMERRINDGTKDLFNSLIDLSTK